MLRLVALALRFPRAWLVGTLVATVLLGAGLLKLRLRTDGAALDDPTSKVALAAERDRLVFADPEQIIVLLSPRPGGPSVETPAGFAYLRRLHEDLRRLPSVRGVGVRSLANLTDLRIGPGAISADPFLDQVPEEPAAYRAWLARLRANPLTEAGLLSRGGSAAIYLPLAEGEDRRRAIREVEGLLSGYRSGPFAVKLTGAVVAQSLLGDSIMEDLGKLMPVMALVIFAVLWLALRSVAGLLLPFVEVAIALLWTLGAMGHAGVPLTLVTTTMPVILMVMSITDELHVLERFQVRLAATLAERRDPVADRQAVRMALFETLRELKRPMLAASFTTCIGFAGFIATTLPALRHFGLFSAFGFLVALLLSVTTMPALALLLPPSWLLPRQGRGARPVSPGRLAAPERWTLALGGRGALVAVALAALALPGVARLRVEDNWVANFAPDAELVQAEKEFNRELWGSYRFDVVFAGPPEHFHQPAGARLVEDFVSAATRAPGVGGALTYLTFVGEVAKASQVTGALSALPETRLSDFINLAGISEDPLGLAQFLTPDGASARVQLYLKGEDYRRDVALAKTVDELLAKLLAGSEVSAHTSGDIPVGLAMVRSIVVNQMRSIGLTYLIIAFLAFAFYAKGWRSLIVLAPVVCSSLLVFGGMGYLGIPLGIATSMFGSISVGVGVDFGFHLIHAYDRALARSRDAAAAVRQALAMVGRAVRSNVAVLAIAFLVLTLSSLRPNHSLGLLLSFAITAAYAMTLLLLPAVLGLGRAARRRFAAVPLESSLARGESPR